MLTPEQCHEIADIIETDPEWFTDFDIDDAEIAASLRLAAEAHLMKAVLRKANDAWHSGDPDQMNEAWSDIREYMRTSKLRQSHPEVSTAK